jgi:uncharacterized membrane protein HdeD (DUF308 family)
MSENAGAERDIADAIADVGGSPWWQIGYGVASGAVGLAALVWPDVTVVVLAVLFGLQLLVAGTYQICAAIAMPDTSAATRTLYVIVGFLAYVIGVVCLRSPEQTVVVLTLVLGAFWLVNGVVDLVQGISGRGEPGRLWRCLGGLVGVVGGVVVLSSPGASALTLAWILGILLVLQGVIMVVAAVSRRRRPVPAPLPPTGAPTPAAPVSAVAEGPDGR